MDFKRTLACLAATLLAAGCGPGVRESRTIHGSADGSALSFQHGQQGVFVSQDGELTKIFQPSPKVLATSSPLWSPNGSRLVFTTATPVQERPTDSANIAEWDANPEGRVYQPKQIQYTCWLYDTKSATEPKKLFDARCHHTGYVAANLAVRWHPSGESLLYLDQRKDGLLELWSWDVMSDRSRIAFPRAAADFIFDWAPDSQHLVCALDGGPESAIRGVWIGRPEESDNWWRVTKANSAEPAQPMVSRAQAYRAMFQGQLATSNSPIERLRASLPAWSADGRMFAYVQADQTTSDNRWQLWLATLESRQTEILITSPYLLSDLAWHPDGKRVGLIEHGSRPALRLLDIDRDGSLSEPLNQLPVRSFAGWNQVGDRFAYVVPDGPNFAKPDEGNWAFLLLVDPLAHDRLVVVEADRPNTVMSGMRITFPNWEQHRISCWATWAPTHQSIFSLIFGLGLRPGDPAATFDFSTRSLKWMPVNAAEKIHVGHYYLANGQYETSLEWYDQARRELPTVARPTWDEFPDSLRVRSSLAIHQAICLMHLGRTAEARTRWKEFYDNFLPVAPTEIGPPSAERTASQMIVEQTLDPDGVWSALIRDLYVAEAFLSLDDAAGAIQHFRNAATSNSTDVHRWSHAVTLSQLLLIAGRQAEYLDLVSQHILPLSMKIRNDPHAPPSWDWMTTPNPDSVILFSSAMALLPACSPEFLKQVEDDLVTKLALDCQALRTPGDDAANLAIDLILQACHAAQAHEAGQQAASARVQQNPARASLLPAEGVAGVIQQLRELTAATMSGD